MTETYDEIPLWNAFNNELLDDIFEHTDDVSVILPLGTYYQEKHRENDYVISTKEFKL